MSAFLKMKGELGEAAGCKLQIWRSHDVDDFLKQLAGTPGIRWLELHDTDATEAGIESIATLPELEVLSIGVIRASEAESEIRLSYIPLESLAPSLAPLAAASSLKRLNLIGRDLPAKEIDELRALLPDCAISVGRGD